MKESKRDEEWIWFLILDSKQFWPYERSNSYMQCVGSWFLIISYFVRDLQFCIFANCLTTVCELSLLYCTVLGATVNACTIDIRGYDSSFVRGFFFSIPILHSFIGDSFLFRIQMKEWIESHSIHQTNRSNNRWLIHNAPVSYSITLLVIPVSTLHVAYLCEDFWLCRTSKTRRRKPCYCTTVL
jgi:hypothetical protein